ncbi:helix-turn-helix domain-containing protein [Nocardia terpenica]|uniref:helix-turn-helix domain-containing protein n=1 Tax=Nocardia terpenica TaxID=455432 RepID=UPI000AC11412|nr:helix-turn-helix transcriptional regulator [Nocardia terpenica]NQE89557.1 helix-turn-helix transcriptional regulator [Nocardia terpenica]
MSDTSTDDDAWLVDAMRMAGIVDTRTGKPSRVELAKRAGIARGTVYNLLSGKVGHILDPSILLRLAATLKKPIGELIGYIEGQQAKPMSMRVTADMQEIVLLALFRGLRTPEEQAALVEGLFEAYKDSTDTED